MNKLFLNIKKIKKVKSEKLFYIIQLQVNGYISCTHYLTLRVFSFYHDTNNTTILSLLVLSLILVQRR
jgi:hypothetical protein